MKIIYRKNDLNFYDVFNFFLEKEKRFTVETTRATSYFIGLKNSIKLITDKTSKKCFLAKNLIIKDFKKSKIDISDIDIKKINYFNFMNIRKGEFKNIYCVDINKAYPTALLNMGLISKSTFDFMLKIPKHERLKAIGMCAAVKYITEYENKKIINFKIKESEFKNIYFAACAVISDIMQEVFKNYNSLFYWFDGIFIKDFKTAENIKNSIEKIGYPCKVEFIEYLKNDGLKLVFKKNNDKKILYLPQTKIETNKKIIDFLNSKNK